MPSHLETTMPWKMAQFCPRERFGRRGLIYFCMVRLLTRISSLSSSLRMRSAPKTAVGSCHLLDQVDRLGREPRLSRVRL